MLLEISIIPQTSEELFYFVTKRIPYLCGFWRFANDYRNFIERSDKMQSKKITKGLLIVYLLALTWIIIFKLQFSFKDIDHLRSVNLIPFRGSVIVNGTISFGEIYNNVFAFIPFGILLCALQQEKPFLKKFIPIFLISLFFETVQFVFAIGASDITDLLANTLGGVIGMGVFFILSKIFKAKVNKVVNIFSLIGAIILVMFIWLLLLSN